MLNTVRVYFNLFAMTFDFDEPVCRRGTASYKWDSRPDLPDDMIPLWVADMDFRVAPPIIDALQCRLDGGVFGYTFVPQAYYDAITRWFDTYHSWHITPEEVIYTSGVVPALSAIIKALAPEGSKVLVSTPVYNCFFSSIRNNGCVALECPLHRTADSYEIDFEAFEQCAADSDCHLFLLCNPHNPACRAWTEDELRRMADICRRHGVTVVSDEIHCEIVFPPYRYTPYATVAPDCRWVACVSPSKAFNIAGLQIANIVCPDPEMRAEIDRAININEVCDVNSFSIYALMAAYNESRPWLEALLPYIHGNYEMLRERFATELPDLRVLKLEATYLAWVDVRALGVETERLEEELIGKCGVWVNAGSMYGAAGEGYIRINLATQRRRLVRALDRLVPALKTYIR